MIDTGGPFGVIPHIEEARLVEGWVRLDDASYDDPRFIAAAAQRGTVDLTLPDIPANTPLDRITGISADLSRFPGADTRRSMRSFCTLRTGVDRRLGLAGRAGELPRLDDAELAQPAVGRRAM